MRMMPPVGFLVAAGIAAATVVPGARSIAAQASLASALTFHASFDTGADADFAAGDRRMFTAASYRALDSAQPGLHNPDATIVAGKGKYGGALQYAAKNTMATYYLAEKNVAFAARDWSGTVSFWLSLDPETDLTGFADPIQLTDKDYNNGALWVDFTGNDKPRHNRLGVFPDLTAWNPEKLTGQTNPAFVRHLVDVATPPYGHGKWTHVAFSFSGLNGAAPGSAKFYLDGTLRGTIAAVPETFTVDPAKMTIRLGVNCTGLFDDLAMFNRALTDAEITSLYALPAGVSGLRR
jgi:hypothetical protein